MPIKHTNIPAAATWHPIQEEWELGEKDAAGKETGIWNYWHLDGHLCGTTDFGDGNPPFLLKRFHPDGTLAQEGNWYGNNLYLGTFRWIKSDNPTILVYPHGTAFRNPKIWTIEFDFIAEGIYNAQRYYNKQNNPVNERGEPLPKRPATIPERAFHMNKRSSITENVGWAMGQITLATGKFIGEYTEWDRKGVPIIKFVYSPETYQLVEVNTYNNGLLASSVEYTTNGSIHNVYQADIQPPVLSQRIVGKGEGDVHRSFFDIAGSFLYSIGSIEDHFHFRRYYNDVLVYEGIQSSIVTEAPVSIRYFHAIGTTLIDYTPHGDGTGTWRLYNEAGEELMHLTETYEEDNNQNNNWDRFMPKWLEYDEFTVQTDWDAIVTNFNEAHSQEALTQLGPPAHLAKELKKVDWEEVETAMGITQLPLAINGLLSESEHIALVSSDRIWNEIEHQGTVYDATYKVAMVLAKVAPFYEEKKAVLSRIYLFLSDVVRLPAIKTDPKLYDKLMATLPPFVKKNLIN
jgi:antitoxin component YwqK of YwqJK toxin-antitoxin module